MIVLRTACLVLLGAAAAFAQPQGQPTEAGGKAGSFDKRLLEGVSDDLMARDGPAVLRAFQLIATSPSREELDARIGSFSAEHENAPELLAAVERMVRNYASIRGRPEAGARAKGDAPPAVAAWRARKVLHRARAELRPKDARAAGDWGLDLYQDRDYRNAFVWLGRSIAGGGADEKVLTAYGGSAMQLGDARLAAEAARRALELDPRDREANAVYQLSKDRVSKIDLPSALRKVGLLSPPSQEGAIGEDRGSADEMVSMNAAAIASVASRQAAAPRPAVEQSKTFTQDAASALTIQDYASAYAAATRAIDLNSQNAQAWNYRAIADNRMGRYGEAVYDASFALGLAPKNPAALQSRSWALSRQRDYRGALADANATLEDDPGNAFAYQSRAMALAGLGDRDGAVEALRRSAELDGRFEERYRRALQAPQAADVLLLFDQPPGERPSRLFLGSTTRRFLRLSVLSLSGGILVALGLLHILSAERRERLTATLRRLGRAAPGGGFWTQYERVRQIGSGGMGVVFEAKDRSLGRTVAVKRLREELRLDPEERRQFLAEARMVAALHHPNIVDIFSIVEDGSDVYLVFEYVDGRTLERALVEDGPFPLGRALRLLRAAAAAVDYAHRRGVIHRDLKPSNVMIASDGEVKVMDFGVAKRAKDSLTRLTVTRTIAGTPPYMAPEQERGAVRSESDIFALAACFYETLCGSRPFEGEGPGLLLAKMNGRHTPLSRRRPELPAALDGVMARALAPDPEKRYRSGAEFVAAVEAVAPD